MRILLDTNILLRLSEKSNAHHSIALSCLKRLAGGGYVFCIASQTIAEFLAVATRPIANHGLGMIPGDAEAELSKVSSALEVLYDSPLVLAELCKLVTDYQVIGKSVHDAKLVAVMVAHDVTEILTFNIRDFARYSEIVVIDPQSAGTTTN